MRLAIFVDNPWLSNASCRQISNMHAMKQQAE